MLEAERIAARYGDVTVFSDVDLAVRPGEVVVVVGPNGVGKSTLLRVLSGIARGTSGHVRLAGEDVMHLSPRVRAARIGVLLEAPDATFGFSVRELVLLGRYPYLGRMGYATASDLAVVERAIEALQLEALADRPYPTLSSGERQRTGIARLMCQATSVMLLDEPTARLDPAHALHVVGLLRAAANAGAAVLAVVHDLDLAAKLADRMIVLAEGRVLASGTPSEVLTVELIERVWKVRARRVDEQDGRPAIVLDVLPR